MNAVEKRVLKSVCHGCHGGCSVLLHVENGVLTEIEGDPDGPLNHGKLCPIGYAAKDLVYHPNRLHHPMKRIGPRGSGQWERITWDEALDTIAGKVKEILATHGPQSVVLGTGTGRHHCKWVIRFANALGTPNWCEPGTAQCFVPRINVGMLTFGAFPVGDFSGTHRPETIVYWGHNPLNSGPDGETRFASRENLINAQVEPNVIVVDPRETELTKRADVWLRLRPGTDDALALAIVHTLVAEDLYDKDFVTRFCHGFGELKAHVAQYTPEWAEPITWVPAESIRAAARLIARAKPMTMEWGCAIEHTPNTIQTVRAVALIPALTGNIDIPGGWVFSGEQLGRFDILVGNVTQEAKAKRLGAGRYKLLTDYCFAPAAHIPAVINAIKNADPYPVKAFLVFGNNTLTTYANSHDVREALEKVEFMTHADLFMTPTAEYADLVLPVAAWPEFDSLHCAPFASSYVMGPIQKAVQVAECRSDEEILIELARRIGLSLCTESLEQTIEDQLARNREPLTFAQLKERGSFIVPIQYRKHEERARRGEKPFATPTGKVELYSTTLAEFGYGPLPHYEEPPESPYSQPELAKKYPLVLTTGHRSPVFFHSEGRQIARQRKAHKEPRTEIHPDTAARYGIRDGEWMFIENERGRIRQRAKFSDAIDPRVIACEHGWWFPEKPGPEYGIWESNVNVLTNNQPPYDPAMGTYQLRGLLCRVGPVQD